MKNAFITIFGFALVVTEISAAADTKQYDQANDRDHLGPAEKMLFWSPRQQIASYRNIEKILPTRLISRGLDTLTLPSNLQNSLAELTYTVGARTFGIQDFIDHNRIAGLLVVKDGSVVLEEYALGNTSDTKWLSFSVTKSIVSLLVGAALKDGFIGSLNDRVSDYLPRLIGSAYDDVTLQNLMQMASGIEWNEDYGDPDSDVNAAADGTDIYDLLRRKSRVAKPGHLFNYNSAETNLVGDVVRSAIGNNLSTHITEKIWTEIGMESDASWVLDAPFRGEKGGCCISATLRDYGRLGMFVLNERKTPSVLPENWIVDSTTPSKANPNYGYLWWLSGRGPFTARGVFGQAIYIDPDQEIVIATNGAQKTATNSSADEHRRSFYAAITEALSTP